MKTFLSLSLLLSLNSFAATKVELRDCEEAGAKLETMLFGADFQKPFYNGRAGIVNYYVGEPAAAPTGIAIVYEKPFATEAGFIIRECKAIPYLAEVNMKAAKSTYNPKTGVTINIPVVKVGVDENEKKIIQINIKTVNVGKPNEGHVINAVEL